VIQHGPRPLHRAATHIFLIGEHQQAGQFKANITYSRRATKSLTLECEASFDTSIYTDGGGLDATLLATGTVWEIRSATVTNTRGPSVERSRAKSTWSSTMVRNGLRLSGFIFAFGECASATLSVPLAVVVALSSVTAPVAVPVMVAVSLTPVMVTVMVCTAVLPAASLALTLTV
jgi:hypothetical protein